MSLVKQVTKIADIDGNKIPKSLWTKLQGYPTYRDQLIKEHIFGPDDITDMIEYDRSLVLTLDERVAFEQIKQHCRDLDCSYFRFVFN